MKQPLIDTFGRTHSDLRVSVTDRCNLRCTYCMPAEVRFLERKELLSFEEIARFVRIATTLGVDKVKLTGGEPLMRRALPELIRMLVGIDGIQDLGLTTNGVLLREQAAELYQAGLRRINISLDTLDPDRFQALTRREGLKDVLDGIHAAKEAGFSPIKLNAVSIRGSTEYDVVALARFAASIGAEMRFIEYMPIGADQWERQKVLFAHELLELLEREIGPLVPAAEYDPASPAMQFRFLEGGNRVGIIASVSRPFCKHCDRMRLTADGKLRNCLFALDEADIRGLLRGGSNDTVVASAIRENIRAKWEGHEINTSRFIKPLRTMHTIGG